ncbi:MAG: hypothetical protein B7Y53_05950, partial [Halothiobacillus sp. 28-55-5]
MRTILQSLLDPLRLRLAKPDALIPMAFLGLIAGILAAILVTAFRLALESLQVYFLGLPVPGEYSALPLMPRPCCRDDLVDFGELRIPPEDVACAGGVTDQRWWIACAAIAEHVGNLQSGNALDRGDNLAHRETGTIAEVDGLRCHPVLQRLQRQHVCLGEVGDMDIVAHAGSV